MPADLQTVQAPAAPAAIGPYSQAVIHGDTIRLSGQLGIDPNTGTIPEDFAVQTRQALKNAQTILEAAGSALSRVISVDVYLVDMSRFVQFNQIYAEAFGGHEPARTVVGVVALPHEAQVEIRCVAATGQGK